jgi:hypothetical protein
VRSKFVRLARGNQASAIEERTHLLRYIAFENAQDEAVEE